MKLLVFDSHTLFYATHLLLFTARFTYCALITAALPVSHIQWCESLHRGDVEGPVAMGFLVMFSFIGLSVAFVYFLTASGIHHFLQRWPWKVAVLDLLLFLVLFGLLVHAGVNAEYK